MKIWAVDFVLISVMVFSFWVFRLDSFLFLIGLLFIVNQASMASVIVSVFFCSCFSVVEFFGFDWGNPV